MGVSVADYLSSSYETDREYLDGTVIARNFGESDHSGVQMALAALLYNQRKALGIHIFPELRVQIAARRFRVPDLAVTVKKIEGRILREPPLLWVEILSPEDRMSRMEAKIEEILAFGTPHVWLLDPRLKKAWSYTIQGRREAQGRIEIPAPPISVDLVAIFDLSDEIES